MRTACNTVSFPRLLTLAAAMGLCLIAVSTTLAQASSDSLSGPKVQDNTPPGNTFGDSNKGGADRKFAQHGPPLGPMLRTLREMGSENAPANVKLSDDQVTQARAIARDFMEQVKAFRQQHADEIKAIRAKAGLPEQPAPDSHNSNAGDANQKHPRRGPGAGGPGAPGGREGGPEREFAGADPKDPKVKEAMQEMRTLMESGPKPQDAETKIWALLNPAQTAYLKQEMGKAQDHRREEMESRAKGKLKGKHAQPGASGNNGNSNPGGAAPSTGSTPPADQ